MNNRTYTFDPPAVVSVPVQGASSVYPVRRIFCVGRNYAAHAKEMGAEVDRTAPWYFNKAREAVVLSGATIAYPAGTHNLHHEMEMVVALGAGAFQIDAENALDTLLPVGRNFSRYTSEPVFASKQLNLPLLAQQ